MSLDATVGGANANSYVTQAEFEAYLEERLHVPAALLEGGSATDEQKEAALIWATRVLDANTCWTGSAATETQALNWPRSGMFSKNGFAIPEDEIPKALKNAQSEMAMLLFGTDLTLQNEVIAQGLTALKAGPVELEWKEEFTQIVVPASVTSLLVPSWLCEVTDPDAPLSALFRVY